MAACVVRGGGHAAVLCGALARTAGTEEGRKRSLVVSASRRRRGPAWSALTLDTLTGLDRPHPTQLTSKRGASLHTGIGRLQQGPDVAPPRGRSTAVIFERVDLAGFCPAIGWYM